MRYRIGIILSFFLFLFSSLHGEAIYAASASVAFSVAGDEFEEGESFVVTITAQSAAGVGGFQTYVAYDTSMLELVDTGKHVTGSDGLIYISDMKKGNKQMREYHVTFKALQPGDTEVYISDAVYMYASTTNEQMSVSKNTLQLHLAEKKQKTTSQVGLTSLKVNEGTLTPEFDRNITKYALDVSSATDMVYIDAKAKLKTDTVKIVGNENLKEGENIATITVTAKNGTTKTYTLQINKATKQEENLKQEEQQVKEAENTEDENQDKSEAALTIYKNGDTTHMKTSVDIEIVPIPSSLVIPAGYKESSIVINSTQITVYAKQDGQDVDHVLIYGRIGEGAAKFYRFDRVGETLQRYTETEDATGSTNKQQASGGNGILYFVVFCMLVIILVQGIRIIRLKKERMYEEDVFPEESEEEDINYYDKF